MTPKFLTLEESLEIHADQIARYGGTVGLRDVGLLHSTLAQPEATFAGQYLHTDFQEMAAAYLFHIVQNHPFIDGNKRVGTVASIVFLRLNDLDIGPTEDELEATVLTVARGQAGKAEIAQFFRDHAV